MAAVDPNFEVREIGKRKIDLYYRAQMDTPDQVYQLYHPICRLHVVNRISPGSTEIAETPEQVKGLPLNAHRVVIRELSYGRTEKGLHVVLSGVMDLKGKSQGLPVLFKKKFVQTLFLVNDLGVGDNLKYFVKSDIINFTEVLDTRPEDEQAEEATSSGGLDAPFSYSSPVQGSTSASTSRSA